MNTNPSQVYVFEIFLFFILFFLGGGGADEAYSPVRKLFTNALKG